MSLSEQFRGANGRVSPLGNLRLAVWGTARRDEALKLLDFGRRISALPIEPELPALDCPVDGPSSVSMKLHNSLFFQAICRYVYCRATNSPAIARRGGPAAGSGRVHGGGAPRRQSILRTRADRRRRRDNTIRSTINPAACKQLRLKIQVSSASRIARAKSACLYGLRSSFRSPPSASRDEASSAS